MPSTAPAPLARPLAGAVPLPVIEAAAERELLGWAMQHRKREQAGFAFEEAAVPAVAGDDGLDRRDPADGFCCAFASSTVRERDPNAEFHDRYLGTVFE